MSGGVSGVIALCTVTYLRPVGLERLLQRIGQLDLTDIDGPVVVIVVDNDAAASAEPIVERVRPTIDVDVTYAVEPTRGITFARNRALELASAAGAKWIGWIDDDEAPRPDWLQRLVTTQRATGADVVMGPPSPIFDTDAPRWIVDSGAFSPASFPSGEPYPYYYTRTSGVIHRVAVVPPEGFDHRLALTGGEDRLFFTRVHRNGGSFVWDAHAVVDEWIPTSRARVRWLVRRWFRVGVTRSLTLIYLDRPSFLRRARRMIGGLAMAVRGGVELLVAVPGGRGAALLSSRRLLVGLGSSYGALGLHVREYTRVHGR